MHIALEGKLRLDRAPETESERHDLRTLKIALMRLGYYRPDSKTGMGEDVDANFTDALYAYQRKSTIAFDDTGLGPNSTTLRVLNEDLAGLDDSEFYIWRTVGDDHVRGEHAARNGKRFSWNNPPDGENPGEDYNCRCWAEPLVASYHPWMAWAWERRELREKLAPPKGLNTETLIEESKLTAGDIARYGVAAAAVIITLRWGGKVPLKTILNIIRSGKLAQSISRQTVDRHIFKKPKGIPKDWIAQPVKKDSGMIYTKPGTKNGTYVKVQKAKPDSSYPGQRYDNVRWQKNGNSLDEFGKIVEKNSLESHIPIEKFKFDITKVQ